MPLFGMTPQPGGVGMEPTVNVDKMRAVPGIGQFAGNSPPPVGVGQTFGGNSVAPGATAAVPRYSMGSTGSVIDNSLSGPTISQGGPFTMPSGAQSGMAEASQPASPYGASNPNFYGR